MATARIGSVVTDSACISIIAPERITNVDERNEACSPTLDKVFGQCFDDLAFSFGTGMDGEYPIVATFDPDTRAITAITIQLIPDKI